MRKTFIAGNWKMHGTKGSVRDLLLALKEGVETADRSISNHAEIAVMPPYIFLAEASDLLKNSLVALGAQNVADALEGAFTGEISAKMLREFGCEYVIIGHSERRAYYSESDELIAKKLVLAVECGLKPVLCVGEQLKEREQGVTEKVIAKQLSAVLELESATQLLANTVIAYEPVWAIGTGLTATPEQAQEVHSFIRKKLKEYVPALAEQLRIIYGGSVKASNATDLIKMPDIDGFLVGGASLKAQEFLEICRCNN